MIPPGRPGAADPAPEPECPWWGLGDVALGLVVAQVLSVIGVVVLYGAMGWKGADASSGGTSDVPLWGTAVLQVPLWVGLAGVTTWAAQRKGSGVRDEFGVWMRWWDAPLGIAVGLATQLLLLPLLYWPLLRLLDKSSDDLSAPARELSDRADSAVGWVVLAVIVVVGAPVVEELFYRGLLLRSLEKRRLAPWVAALLSAAVFAAMHLQALQFMGLFVFGLVLAALAQGFGRLGPSIWAHAAFNAATVVALWAAS